MNFDFKATRSGQTGSPQLKAVEKPPIVRLTPLDTSVTRNNGPNSAYSANATSPQSLSASRAKRGGFTPLSLKVPPLPQQQQVKKPLPPSPRRSRSPRDYLNKLLTSPRFLAAPPLSARSAEFLFTLQQSLHRTFDSAVDTYLHRRFSHSAKSPPCQRSGLNDSISEYSLESQDEEVRPRMNIQQKLIIGTCLAFIVVLFISMAIFTSGNHMTGPRHAQHFIMGGTGGIVVFAAVIMMATRRSIMEIFTMAMVAILICQCVMHDFDSTF